MAKYLLRPDTPAWIAQSWGFFAMACLFEAMAIWWLDLALAIRWLLLLLLVLTIYVCFALSKMIRDNRDRQVDTGPWILMTWLVSGIAVIGLVSGMQYVSGEWRTRMVLLGGLAWCIQASLVLAKTIRDNDEARKSAAEVVQSKPPSLDLRSGTEKATATTDPMGGR